MDKIKSIDFNGVHIPLSIPVEIDLSKFFNDDNISPTTQHDLLLFSIVQEQLKTLRWGGISR